MTTLLVLDNGLYNM